MREFLFRGKCKEINNWAYGFFDGRNILECRDTVSRKLVTVVDKGVRAYIQSRRGVIPETVGQYIGLRDKHKKRVFEGDIIKYIESGFVGIVKFGVYGFNKDYGYYIEWINDYYGLLRKDILYCIEEGAIVVGNIYDNPELLEVKK